jgi:hypothetical protein
MATAGQPTNKPEYCELVRGAGESMRHAGD